MNDAGFLANLAIRTVDRPVLQKGCAVAAIDCRLGFAVPDRLRIRLLVIEFDQDGSVPDAAGKQRRTQLARSGNGHPVIGLQWN